MEDVVIFLWTLPIHIDHVRSLLTLLRDDDIALTSNRCDLLIISINYLAHIIIPRQLKITFGHLALYAT